MASHDRAVDHSVFVVGVGGLNGKDSGPHPQGNLVKKSSTNH